MTPRQAQIVAAMRRFGDATLAAADLGIKPVTVRDSLGRSGLSESELDALYWANPNALKARQGKRSVADSAYAEIEAAGYELGKEGETPASAWADHVTAFERKLTGQRARIDRTIDRNGPFVIFHATDEHIDDDASALKILEQDIKDSHGMGSIMMHGGDLLNNWPMGGKLAKQWAEQSCPLPSALLRAQHFIDIFKPDVWVDGNHEEMNPYLVNLFDTWLPKDVIKDYWRCDFTVKTKGGRDCRVALSHKFQKGSSWFHGLHGHIRETLQSEARDIYFDGHYHIDGVMHYTMPERGHSAVLVASAGYKMIDKWGSRISRGGKIPKIAGRAHWAVIDPYTEADMCSVFKDAAHAEVYYNSLQNLRQI